MISDVEQFVDSNPKAQRFVDKKQMAKCKPNEYLIIAKLDDFDPEGEDKK